MNFSSYETPKVRLYNQVCSVIKAMRKGNLSRGSAEARLFAAIAEDPDMMLELVRKDRMMQFIGEHIAEVEQRDFDGGGIGLLPVTKTGSNAVADEMGHTVVDTLEADAPSSAPQSQTPAAMPVGGGQPRIGSHIPDASPSYTWSPSDYPGTSRKIKPPVNPPAVSNRILAKVAKDSANEILKNIKCNGRSVLQATAHEAMKWADSVKRAEGDKITASKKRIAEAQIVEHFAAGVPPTMTIGEFYEEHPHEYQKRRATVGKGHAYA